jgi:two-component system chemotaxis response regulator CheY
VASILIVDDSKTSRKLLRELLETNGFEIAGEAVDGEEGYQMFKSLHPDLVTMDITMPKMDGIESLSLIRHVDENAKVIMITAAGQREKMVEALKRGAEDFLTKPFDANRVVETIKEVLDIKD